MGRNKFRKPVCDEHPYLPKEYDYPMFKKGDVVWVLEEGNSSFQEFLENKYTANKAIVMEGPIGEDSEYWEYKIMSLNEYEDEEISNDELDEYIYEVCQIKMFHRLSLLKKCVEYKCNMRISVLKENIDCIHKQNEYIQNFVDEQEHREQQINSVIK